MKKFPYKEGDVFTISLRDGRFSLGLVTRSPKHGGTLLGYFFRHTFVSVPSPNDVPALKPQDAIKVMRFGDLSLMNGEWPIIFHLPNWDRDNWAMPKFVRQDPLSKKAWLVSYDDHDPNIEAGEERCDFDVAGYERASLCGAGFVEIVLTKILQPRNA